MEGRGGEEQAAPGAGRRGAAGGRRRPVPLIEVNPSFCKRCGICIAFCPTRVFDAREDGLPLVSRRRDCIWCELCEVRCPDFAITLRPEEAAAAGGER